MRMPPGPSVARAFTIVEMLVVIGILLILVALLLPALRNVREQGRSIKCQSNLRQTGVALRLYANDYSQVIPQPSWYVQTTSGAQTQRWHAALQGRLGGTEYLKPASATLANSALYCPKNGQMARGITYSRPGTYAMVNTAPRYGVPSEPSYFKIAGPTPTPIGFISFEGTRLLRIQRASDFMIVGDSSIERPGNATFLPDEGSFTFRSFFSTNTGGAFAAGLWSPHHKRVNGLFADGHVESCDAARLLSTSNLNGNTVAGGYPSDRPRGISWWRNEDFTESRY